VTRAELAVCGPVVVLAMVAGLVWPPAFTVGLAVLGANAIILGCRTLDKRSRR
jgi:hypothetical protein